MRSARPVDSAPPTLLLASACVEHTTCAVIMSTRVSALWSRLLSSLWFVPALIVFGAVLLAVGLIELSEVVDQQALTRFPRLFGADAGSSRETLAAIAGSMMTVAGVTFSITVVAVSQASGQYTPRILRNFMRDRPNQVVLGLFVGIFTYCLVVLRTIRGDEEIRFIPSLAVLGGVVLAVVGVGVLIYFIHHVASTLQASTIIARVSRETVEAVDHLFPDELGAEPNDPAGASEAAQLASLSWYPVAASRTGYVQAVDPDDLIRIAREQGTVVRMDRGIGDFVVDGTSLAAVGVVGGRGPIDGSTARALRGAFTLSTFRTVQQDPAFGVRQLVDIALRALSPGVNDTTTAVTCVDYLGAILARMGRRRFEPRLRTEGGTLRVIARGPTFETLLDAAFDQIRRNAEGNVTVLERMLGAIETVAGQTASPARRVALRAHVARIDEVAERTIPSAHDRASLAAARQAAARALS
jgi:uncharacterized membrane protein